MPSAPLVLGGPSDRLEIDVSLLRGFRFECRPDCGLCCYAEPRIEPAERVRLLKLEPMTRFRARGRAEFLAARAEGGACPFLDANRCRVHPLRPHPCREFPVTVHVGRRLQASVVLSCPGVDLSHLTSGVSVGEAPDPIGLDAELAAVRERIGPGVNRRVLDASRRARVAERRLRADGRWNDDGEVRRTLRRQLPEPGDSDFPVEDPPALEQGLDRLPLFFDGRAGPLALASGLGGWEVLELRPDGSWDRLDLIVPPERPPRVTAEGSRLLEGYLRYWLERDAFVASAQLDALEARDGTVVDWAASELRTIAAMTLARAFVRATLRRSGVEPLSLDDVADGIRAVDQDWLDRPTWGDRL